MNTAQTIASVGFDVANLTAPKERITHKVPVLFDDDGNPTAGFIIVGKDSDEFRNEYAQIRIEGQKRSAVKKTAIDTKTDEGATKMVELIDSNQSRLAVAVTVDWWGFTSAGATVAFDKKLAAAAFAKFPTWQDKVSIAMEEDSNFLKLSSPVSSPTPSTSSAV